MKVLCKIKRPGGSFVEVPGSETITYHFAPNEHGDHVADVSNKEHVKRLLGIDAYEVYEGPAAAAPVAPPAAPELTPASGPPTEETPHSDGDREAILRAECEQMTVEDLQAEYHHIYGKAAHPQIKFGTLVEKVVAGKLATKG